MAVRDVIHFPFWAQLSTPLWFPALLLPEPVAKSPPENEDDLRHAAGEARLGVLVAQEHLQKQPRGSRMRTDIYAEFYLWNKNVDSLIRVLQRLEALRNVPAQALKECEIRLEELRSAWNVRILETMLAREQTDHGRFSSQREALDNASPTTLRSE